MTDPRSFFDAFASDAMDALFGVLPDDVVVSFEIEGPGGGAWQLSNTSIGPVDPRPKDCEIRCKATDFMAIVSGQLEPREAFMSGRIQVQGDIGLALRLQGLLAAA